MDQYAVFVEGLDDLNLVDIAPQIEKAAYQSINKTAVYARAHTSDLMRKQYNFPGNYLNPASGLLIVSKRASLSNLEATITARRRSSSLARFMVRGEVNRMGVAIEMKKGKVTELEHAFPVKLNGGQSMGLAIRTKSGERPNHAYKPSRLGNNLWLLYGISVNQAFNYSRSMTAKASEIYLADAFDRMMSEIQL